MDRRHVIALGICARLAQSGQMSQIEYVYSAHSAFAYLGSAELLRICRAHDVTLIHRPIILSPVMEAQGARPFADRSRIHYKYFFGREIERWAEYRGVALNENRPSHHDADYSLASGMILALGDTGPATDALSHRLLEAHWRDDADLSDAPTLAAIASQLGHDADALLAQATSPEVRAKQQANDDWARANEIFGSPTYIVNGDPFYGQDRLELVERALTQPFAPPRFFAT